MGHSVCRRALSLLSYLVLSCTVSPRLAVSCRDVSCRVLSCLVLSCLVLSCLVLCLSCLVLSCLVLSCLILSRRVFLVWSCLVISRVVSSFLVLYCLVFFSLRGWEVGEGVRVKRGTDHPTSLKLSLLQNLTRRGPTELHSVKTSRQELSQAVDSANTLQLQEEGI